MLMVVPAQENPSHNVLDYPLMLVSGTRFISPSYYAGQKIPDMERVREMYPGVAFIVQPIVEGRRVVLDASGNPSYRYHLRLEAQEGQADLSEEELAVLMGHGSNSM